MDFKKISDTIFQIFADNNIEVVNKNDQHGYYFDETDNQYWNFKVKGIKRWKFGMWIHEIEKNSNKCKVELFGQHEDYIDKFKPSASPGNLCYEIEFHDNEVDDKENFWLNFTGFMDQINQIKCAPLIYMYITYGPSMFKSISFIQFIINWFWFYRIEYPIREFIKYEGNVFLAKIIKILLKIRYRNLDVEVKNLRSEFFFPAAKIEITFPFYYSEEKKDQIYNSWIVNIFGSGFQKALSVDYYEQNFLLEDECGDDE